MHEVKKLNKRLIITNDGVPVYHMPYWVQVTNRQDMQWLADRFNAANDRDIDAIMEFESKHSTVRKRKPVR